MTWWGDLGVVMLALCHVGPLGLNTGGRLLAMPADERPRRSPFVARATTSTPAPSGARRRAPRGLPAGDAFSANALAGLTVAALAIPSAMGFAEVAWAASGDLGLYALLLPVVAYAFLGELEAAGRRPGRDVGGSGRNGPRPARRPGCHRVRGPGGPARAPRRRHVQFPGPSPIDPPGLGRGLPVPGRSGRLRARGRGDPRLRPAREDDRDHHRRGPTRSARWSTCSRTWTSSLWPRW